MDSDVKIFETEVGYIFPSEVLDCHESWLFSANLGHTMGLGDVTQAREAVHLELLLNGKIL